MDDILERAKRVRLVIFDVDGVLTDGSLYLSDSGEEMKAFNTLDGHGMKMLQASGVVLAIITGRRSRCVELRAQNLGISHLYQGASDKLVAYRDLLEKLQLRPDETAYMGDDVVDLPVMRRAGFAIAVPDAPDIVRQNAHYVTRRSGGRGAVREACEFLMRMQDSYDAMIAEYL
ncbi:MAG: 3-deoxy-manno-octulosonate-8-phosphatase KdsC [Burkholderiales bacterium]|nr:3-deoxy-manno-octulosonate-8-phosphatase KdsC [Burkholderiales bacterium]